MSYDLSHIAKKVLRAYATWCSATEPGEKHPNWVAVADHEHGIELRAFAAGAAWGHEQSMLVDRDESRRSTT